MARAKAKPKADPKADRRFNDLMPGQADDDDELLNFSDAGKLVNVSRGTVWNWANAGAFAVTPHPSGVDGVWKSEFIRSYQSALEKKKQSAENRARAKQAAEENAKKND